MKINITNDQYKMLLKMTTVSTGVYGILVDNVSEEYRDDYNTVEEFENYILGYAKDFGCEDLVEEYNSRLIISDGFSEEMDVIMDDYDDETFWNELETKLGKRDFERDMTEEEMKKAEEDGFYSEKIWDYYEKYGKEFEENGINRLEIVKKM